MTSVTVKPSISDITKTEFNYSFIIYCFMENIQTVLCEMKVDFICASKNTRINAPGGHITQNHQVLALFSQRCVTHVHCTRYNRQI